MNRRVWTERYARPPRELPQYDGWLDRWDPTLRDIHAERILDLGCGRGADSAVLTGWGYRVVRTDFVEDAVSFVNRRLGTRTGVVADHSVGLPFRSRSFHAVVADLTLHYFEDAVTRRILREIRRVLVPDGLMLARFNAFDDLNHGADQAVAGGATIHGVTKQFFTEARLRGLFEGVLSVRSCEHYATNCYEHPKRVLEICAMNGTPLPDQG